METSLRTKNRNPRGWLSFALKAGAAAAFCAPIVLLPAGVAAQALDPAELHEVDDDRTDITHENLTVDEIEDMDVVRDGEVIGEVEEVLANDDDEIVALVVEYGGNIVGVGDKEVIVPIDDLEFTVGRDEVQTTMTDGELAELLAWDR